MIKKRLFRISILLIFIISFTTRFIIAGDVKIIDTTHYSNVFGELRNYRIFLPPGYSENIQKKYPVIYFLHGWSQRYFGIGPIYSNPFDSGTDNNGDNIANFVSTHDVIVVKSDGYNRTPDEEYYVRPYNIGTRSQVETYRQFPVYYPELVNCIDDTYRTIADREHRAISGLSMGGFMTFWIGGKYPDLFSAAGNFCGSAEFFVGPKEFPVEYHHKYLYRNYGGMNVRLNYGNRDFIRSYHDDFNRVWTQVMNNYEIKTYEAAHSTCGLGEMFDFLLNTFKDPPEKPSKWTHTDVYPLFSVWDYIVNSDRDVPGFTTLENVDKRGFRCSVRELLPDGELLSFVNLRVTTAPVYEKNQQYIINDFDIRNLKAVQYTIMSDNSGRLRIAINGNIHEIGINRKGDKPSICIASVEIENREGAVLRKDINLSVRLLNKGFAKGEKLTGRLSATRNTTHIIRSQSEFKDININEVQGCLSPFVFKIESDSIEIAQFLLTVTDDHKNEWSELFEIPLRSDLPLSEDFVIADGKIFTVAAIGDDTETTRLGSGNGDGHANPGESIIILIKDKGIYRRTLLSTSDKYINPFGINTRKSDDWFAYDYVGASSKFNIPLIASDCPENHIVEFYAGYWRPVGYPLHSINYSKVKIEISGKDTTPPEICWVKAAGDNLIRIKLLDGSKIKSVKAKLILRVKDEAEKSFAVELNDEGLNGDQVIGDNVFSQKLPQKDLGFYRMLIEARDSYGNILTEEASGKYLLH